MVSLGCFTSFADSYNTSLFAKCAKLEGTHKQAAKKELNVRNGFLISLIPLALTAAVAFAQDESAPQPKTADKTANATGTSPQKLDPEAASHPLDGLFSEGGCGCGSGCGSGCCPSCCPDCCSSCFPGCCDDCCDGCDSGCAGRLWGSMEYLLWWVKDGPVPGPLVTTSSNPNNPLAGAIGQSGTSVLFGGSNLDYGTFSGGRLTIGGWIGPDQLIGIEANAFLLEQRSSNYAAASNASGNPALYLPALFNNGTTKEEDRLVVSSPVTTGSPNTVLTGNVVVDSTTRLWGSEVNGVFGSWCSGSFQGSFLAGFRYLDLHETLSLENTTTSTTTVDSTPSSFTASLADMFETRNQFYGGQIGAKASWCWNFLSCDVIGKLALGDTHQVVNVTGVSSISGSGTPVPPGVGTFPGGFYAQPSNIGRQSNDEFTVVPEVELKLNCDICCGVRAFIGYDFLYWNQVVRPGSEVDRNLNLTQSPVISQTNGTLVGAAYPQSQFNRTDFYANGLMFGLELRYQSPVTSPKRQRGYTISLSSLTLRAGRNVGKREHPKSKAKVPPPAANGRLRRDVCF